MVIESVVICMDNSEYMRNEDIAPSRLMAQCEAADLIVQTVLRTNPENNVAVVTMSDNQVIAHLTTDEAKLLTEIYKVGIDGPLRIMQGLGLAQLALKHKPVKNHKSRIIALIGSPVSITETELTGLGKKFKKENVTVDVVKFGCEDEGSSELEKLVSVMNGPSGGSNNFFVVPAGVGLSEALATSNIIGRQTSRTMGGQIVNDEDEDLRMALEMSLRESGGPSQNTPNVFSPHSPQPTGIQDGNALSEDEQLALAIRISLQEVENNNDRSPNDEMNDPRNEKRDQRNK